MESALAAVEDSVLSNDLLNPVNDKETKMPRGRRQKAVPAPKKFERQEALKNRIVALSEELGRAGFSDLLTALTPIKPVAPEVLDQKTRSEEHTSELQSLRH